MIAFISSVLRRTAEAISVLSWLERTTAKRHGWRFVLDGAVVAASTSRARSGRSIGLSRKCRTLRRDCRSAIMWLPSVIRA